MTNIRQKLLLVVFFALLVSTRPASALLSCTDLFSVKPQNVSELVNSELVRVGLKPQAKPNIFARFREWRTFRGLDPYQLISASLRESAAQQILEMRSSQSLDVLPEKTLSKSERAALTRIVLRSVIHHGLLNRAEFELKPSNVQRVRRAFARLFQQPAFRALVFLELPTKKVVLSESELWSLLNRGTDSEKIQALVKTETGSTNVRTINKFVSRIMTIGYIAASVWITYPTYSAQYDLVQAKKSEQFKQAVVTGVTIDTGSMALTMANGEKRAVIASFEARYHDKPTEAEEKQIRTEVCTTRYGAMLSAGEHASCLAK